jgi:hypothetical protein
MERLILGLCLAVSIFAVGCGSDTDSTNTEMEMQEDAHRAEACMHMTEGPATDIVAAGTADDATNTSAADWLHKRVDLSFEGIDADSPAFVTYEATEAGEYEIYVSAEASIRVDGVEPEMSLAFDECSTAASIHVFDLEVGEHIIEIVTSNRPLQLVVELMGGDHSDHDDHEGEDHEGGDHSDHDDHEGEDHEGEDHEGEDHEGEDHEGEDHEGEDHEGEESSEGGA